MPEFVRDIATYSKTHKPLERRVEDNEAETNYLVRLRAVPRHQASASTAWW